MNRLRMLILLILPMVWFTANITYADAVQISSPCEESNGLVVLTGFPYVAGTLSLASVTAAEREPLSLAQRWRQNWKQWLWAILIMAIVVWIWQRLPLSLSSLLYFVVSGLVLWIIMDLSRSLWQSLWWRIAGHNAPDLAILVALLPLISWAVNRLSRR